MNLNSFSINGLIKRNEEQEMRERAESEQSLSERVINWDDCTLGYQLILRDDILPNLSSEGRFQISLDYA